MITSIEPTEEEIVSEASFIEMKAYVKYCTYFGYTKQEIITALKKAGWRDDEISKAFLSLKLSAAPKKFIPNPSENTELEIPKPIIEPIEDVPKPSS